MACPTLSPKASAHRSHPLSVSMTIGRPALPRSTGSSHGIVAFGMCPPTRYLTRFASSAATTDIGSARDVRGIGKRALVGSLDRFRIRRQRFVARVVWGRMEPRRLRLAPAWCAHGSQVHGWRLSSPAASPRAVVSTGGPTHGPECLRAAPHAAGNPSR